MADILGWITLGIIPFFLLVDLVYRRQNFRTLRFSRGLGFAVTAFSFGLSLVIATGWAQLVGDRSVFNLSGLGVLGGTVVGIVVYEVIHYGYHRLAHEWGPLWRIHQMHHSTESLDAFNAYFLHPLDVVFFTTWSSLVFFPLLGLEPMAGVIGALFLTFNAMFQHANIKTPRWVGYIIQRPESHSVHHAREVHRYNYSDLALVDMVFGTFRNPAEWEPEVGFYHGASSRIPEMLVGMDVTEPRRKGTSANDWEEEDLQAAG